jgi:toxin CcdB
MAQFNVHVAPGRDRAAVPYVVIIQSRRFDQLGTRVVAPLMAVRTQPKTEGLSLTPAFTIQGTLVYLNPLEIQTIPRSRLGRRVASLADDASSGQIIRAIDELITRAYG